MSTLATTASHLSIIADVLRQVPSPTQDGYLLLVTDNRGERFVIGDEDARTLEELEAYDLAATLAAHHDYCRTNLLAEVIVVNIERISEWL